MNTDALRAAFLAGANGALDLKEAGLSYSGPLQVLKFTGFHDDSLPFAFISAPFAGDPVERAKQIAADIVAAHIGQPVMPAPTPITGLAATLRDSLKAATDRAAALSAKAQGSVKNLHGVLDTADVVVADLDKAAADIQAALGLSTNGGPALDPLAPSEKPQG